ncbi:integral membrane sensor signal transduction histidine kinase [Haloterrigena turkmenica DSM 5511]|uniref:histidine kinase n=1 Tax=Haloterrigena turkmenica (strain ATCC 51198 / DSM 5511 / JCM 9101 / NCIMB 13204 / VKM B-1734 / 4k) TaxID=543526 RepID=D2RPC1_HALTV|nr:sensor histidine kinase [Haloterrigena turkmenica]ADB60155.1 integral membrane sensor signal transduction histidine kinase [Haloterrigena turkmenica DSM 5511]
MRVRLRTKFVVILVVITLVLSGTVHWTLESYKRDVVDDEQQRTDETASLVAEQIDATIWEHRDRIGLVASRPEARQFDRSGPFLDAFLDNSRFYSAQLVDANGTVVDFRGSVTAGTRRSVIGSDRSGTPYVERALRGETYVSDVEYAERADRPVLVFSAPILDGSGVRGVLVGAMYLDRQTIFDAIPPLETSSQTVTIVGDGVVLNENERTFDEGIESSSTVESTGWEVTVTRDRTLLEDRLDRLAALQTLVLVIVVLVMVGFGYWQYAVSLRQTERLLDGFDRLGEGDYDSTVSLRGGAEWERMSDGFNELVATLRARESELRERRQRLDVLYRVLQHNIRNRMSIVLNYADLITDEAADETVVGAAETIHRTGRDITGLSRKARQMKNALEADPDRRPVDVASLAADAVAELREEYPDVTVTASLPDEAWAMALPSVRLAVENVCENACEHNDSADPRVEIAVTATGPEPDVDRDPADENGGRVRIEVADNGPGIPEQDRAAIDEGRETALEHGSGLGLWLTYWVVDNSGGTLRFDDNDPRGSIVIIDLPRAAPRRGDANAPEPSSHVDDRP